MATPSKWTKGPVQYHLQPTWVICRNLPSQDFVQAYRVMQATANQNKRCHRPVYALTLFFHPDDRTQIDQLKLVSICDALVLALGLGGYQHIIIGPLYNITPTVHVVVNRVHPETLRAATLSDDFLTISRFCEKTERALGLHQQERRRVNNLARRNGVFVKERHRYWFGFPPPPNAVSIEACVTQCVDRVSNWSQLIGALRTFGIMLASSGKPVVRTDPISGGTYKTQAGPFVFSNPKTGHSYRTKPLSDLQQRLEQMYSRWLTWRSQVADWQNEHEMIIASREEWERFLSTHL